MGAVLQYVYIFEVYLIEDRPYEFPVVVPEEVHRLFVDLFYNIGGGENADDTIRELCQFFTVGKIVEGWSFHEDIIIFRRKG